MHVAVDGRALRPGAARARGVARYLRCLLDELGQAFPEDRYELVDPGRARLATAALAGRPRLDRLAAGCDVVWAPAPAPVAVSAGTPLVLTVHDLSFEHRARDYPLYDRLWQRLARPGRLARRAERVICVSEADAPRSHRRMGSGWRARADGAVRPGPPGRGRPRCIRLAARRRARRASCSPWARSSRASSRVCSRRPTAGPGATGFARSWSSQATGRSETSSSRPGPSCSATFRDDVLDASTSVRSRWCAPHARRASASRRSRRPRAARPRSSRTCRCSTRRSATPRCGCRAGDADALAAALLRMDASRGSATSLRRQAREAAARLSWERAARETRAALAEAAG